MNQKDLLALARKIEKENPELYQEILDFKLPDNLPPGAYKVSNVAQFHFLFQDSLEIMKTRRERLIYHNAHHSLMISVIHCPDCKILPDEERVIYKDKITLIPKRTKNT